MTTTTWITRREAAEDIPMVRDIIVAAFDTADEADLVDALRRGPRQHDSHHRVDRVADFRGRGLPLGQRVPVPTSALPALGEQLASGVRDPAELVLLVALTSS